MDSEMISVLSNFSENPAGRFIKDGPFSGERFRDELLVPALKKGTKLTVNLDGALGYGSSFLEEAFGGLVRKGYTAKDLRERLIIQSKLATYRNRVWRYIDEESKRRFGV